MPVEPCHSVSNELASRSSAALSKARAYRFSPFFFQIFPVVRVSSIFFEIRLQCRFFNHYIPRAISHERLNIRGQLRTVRLSGSHLKYQIVASVRKFRKFADQKQRVWPLGFAGPRERRSDFWTASRDWDVFWECARLDEKFAIYCFTAEIGWSVAPLRYWKFSPAHLRFHPSKL